MLQSVASSARRKFAVQYNWQRGSFLLHRFYFLLETTCNRRRSPVEYDARNTIFLRKPIK